MDRLTERLSNGQAAVYGCGNNCKYDFKYCNNHLEDCPTINEIYERLAQYEEIGTVECFKNALKNVRTLSNMYEKLRDQEVAEFHKLAEYEDLEEQGKLLKLPCAVGDTVYSFSCRKILILRVDSFIVYADGIDARLVSDMEEYKFLKAELDITDFGKKWFATHEEAEAALKEL